MSGRLSSWMRNMSSASAAGEILPATAVSRPAARHSSPTSAVVVVLPLVPVMAMTLALSLPPSRQPNCYSASANSSISPVMEMP